MQNDKRAFVVGHLPWRNTFREHDLTRNVPRTQDRAPLPLRRLFDILERYRTCRNSLPAYRTRGQAACAELREGRGSAGYRGLTNRSRNLSLVCSKAVDGGRPRGCEGESPLCPARIPPVSLHPRRPP